MLLIVEAALQSIHTEDTKQWVLVKNSWRAGIRIWFNSLNRNLSLTKQKKGMPWYSKEKKLIVSSHWEKIIWNVPSLRRVGGWELRELCFKWVRNFLLGLKDGIYYLCIFNHLAGPECTWNSFVGSKFYTFGELYSIIDDLCVTVTICW